MVCFKRGECGYECFNRAYDVTETRSFIKTRALSIVFTLAIIFMIVFALIVPVFGQVIGAAVFKAIGLSDSLRVEYYAVSSEFLRAICIV